MKKIYTNKKEVILVDGDDYGKISKYTWHLSSHGYAIANTTCRGKRKHIKMHRFLLEAKNGQYGRPY